MKSLRKSLGGSRDHGHAHQSSVSRPSLSKPASAIIPPKKVIRALTNHRSQGPTELSFQKGDFFYVIREINEQGAWFEVHNPATNARGLVPRSLFEDVLKNNTNNRTFSTISTAPSVSITGSAPAKQKPRVYYAIVLHDFTAERTDELDAKAGEGITIVAQSNREWFVAKPIGKLGRPGLIPTSFVEVRDPVTSKVTNIDTILNSGALPSVEEWKKEVMDYKASSITLGVLDVPPQRQPGNGASPQSPSSPAVQQPLSARPISGPTLITAPSIAAALSEPEPQNYTPVDSSILPEGILLEAEVVSFHYEEEYWFRVHAIFQPYGASPTAPLPPARQLVLFRAYNDFYDFQVELIAAFPHEAGQVEGYARVLPYMPGPAEEVSHEITASRQVELDEYLRRLADLRLSRARYIVEDVNLRSFLTPKPGDVEHEIEPRTEEIEALFAQNDEEGVAEVANQMGRLSVNNVEQRPRSGDSYYDEEAIRHPYANAGSNGGHSRSGSSAALHMHQRGESTSSLHGPSPLPPHMQGHTRNSSRAGTPQLDGYGHQRNSSHSRFSQPASPAAESNGGFGSAPSSAGSRTRSGSLSAAQSMNSPPISASNPAMAFVKIKVFDNPSGEVIALRVHPRVSLRQLCEKVAQRLGGRMPESLRYTTQGGDVYVDDNEMLTEWIENTDKHVLWAD